MPFSQAAVFEHLRAIAIGLMSLLFLNPTGWAAGLASPCGNQGNSCATDAECNDTLACNGDETCDNLPATAMCCTPDGINCITVPVPQSECFPPYVWEGMGTCTCGAPICDDGIFCNGAEVCTVGGCTDQPGPCVDLAHCDEGLQICLECLDDGECEDVSPCTIDTCVLGECVHDRQPACERRAYLDIQPGVCPNFINWKSRGSLVVALAGSPTFDVGLVDLSSLILVRLDGAGDPIRPVSVAAGFVATPSSGDPCSCHLTLRDRIKDLSLKFDLSRLVETMKLDLRVGTPSLELALMGTLDDGTPFVASDCLIVGNSLPPPRLIHLP